MYSKEFMKFLYEYQKDEFKPQEDAPRKINLKTPRTGKFAKVYVPVKNK